MEIWWFVLHICKCYFDFRSMFNDDICMHWVSYKLYYHVPQMISGSWFNKKCPLTSKGNPHFGDKTVLRPSYLHNEISFTGKTSSLYSIRAQVCYSLHITDPGDPSSQVTDSITSITYVILYTTSRHCPVPWQYITGIMPLIHNLLFGWCWILVSFAHIFSVSSLALGQSYEWQ